MEQATVDLVITLASFYESWFDAPEMRKALELGLIDHIALRRETVSDCEGERTVTSASFVLRTQPHSPSGDLP